MVLDQGMILQVLLVHAIDTDSYGSLVLRQIDKSGDAGVGESEAAELSRSKFRYDNRLGCSLTADSYEGSS